MRLPRSPGRLGGGATADQGRAIRQWSHRDEVPALRVRQQRTGLSVLRRALDRGCPRRAESPPLPRLHARRMALEQRGCPGRPRGARDGDHDPAPATARRVRGAHGSRPSGPARAEPRHAGVRTRPTAAGDRPTAPRARARGAPAPGRSTRAATPPAVTPGVAAAARPSRESRRPARLDLRSGIDSLHRRPAAHRRCAVPLFRARSRSRFRIEADRVLWPDRSYRQPARARRADARIRTSSRLIGHWTDSAKVGQNRPAKSPNHA